MSEQEHQGGCLCGSVRYRIAGPPLATVICYCENCRRQSGSALSVNLTLLETQFEVSGETRAYQDLGESGATLWRAFCPGCGSPVSQRSEAMPGVVLVKAGTLDDPGWLDPNMEVFTCDAPAWIRTSAPLLQCARNPTPEDMARLAGG